MIAIRPATIADASSIAELHVASWRAAYRELMPASVLSAQSVADRTATWANDIATAAANVFVAETDDSITGLLSLAPSRDADAEAGAFEILALYVSPSAWSTGVGRSLCTAAESFARHHNGKLISLWTLTGNARAHRFYSSIGFLAQPESIRPYRQHDLSLRQMRYSKPIADSPTE